LFCVSSPFGLRGSRAWLLERYFWHFEVWLIKLVFEEETVLQRSDDCCLFLTSLKRRFFGLLWSALPPFGLLECVLKEPAFSW